MYKRKEPTVPAMVAELYQAVLGIRGTEEKGMVGKIDKIEEHLKELNGKVALNTTFRKVGTWVSCTMAAGIIGLLCKLIFGD